MWFCTLKAAVTVCTLAGWSPDGWIGSDPDGRVWTIRADRFGAVLTVSEPYTDVPASWFRAANIYGAKEVAALWLRDGDDE